jgi:hypothetical protein
MNINCISTSVNISEGAYSETHLSDLQIGAEYIFPTLVLSNDDCPIIDVKIVDTPSVSAPHSSIFWTPNCDYLWRCASTISLSEPGVETNFYFVVTALGGAQYLSNKKTL